MADTPNAELKAKKHRSPIYPGINLQQAIKRTAEFYEKEHRNPASFKAAVVHWGYSEKSSGALVTVSALKGFGLIDELDSSGSRTFQVSPLGLKIVADKRPESTERDEAIREAALKPKIHAELWRKYNGRLPSDAELQYRLENDWHFNVNVIGSFIKELRDTISYAKLSDSDKIEEKEVDGDGNEGEDVDDKHPYVPKVGDFVQWKHNEVLGFNEPKRIREISSDGAYVFIDGQYTGIPANELILENPPAAKPASQNTPPPLQQSPKSLMQEFVVPLSEGSRAIFQWPVSLTKEDILDLKDSLKILERKIDRSVPKPEEATKSV
jgi:hypothetical protein